jgi:hypothetical protein
VDGLDSKKFTLVGDKLTFEATDFEARKNATYHVKIRSTFSNVWNDDNNSIYTTSSLIIFIDKAPYVWNDDNNSMLAINNFITFIENP